MRWNDLRPRTPWAVAAIVAAWACADPPAAPLSGATHTRDGLLAKPGTNSDRCDPDNGGLTLPTGFCAVVVARDLGRARHMAERPNGDLYVAINNGPGTTLGAVVALREMEVEDSARDRRLIWYGRRIGGHWVRSDLEAKLRQVITALSGLREARVIILSTNCDGQHCDIARDRLTLFAEAAAGSLFDPR